MSLLQIYRVDFCLKKASAGGAGKADAYRREVRSALVSAASSHPKDILAVLNADLTIPSGEVVDILAVNQVVGGSKARPSCRESESKPLDVFEESYGRRTKREAECLCQNH